MDLGANRALDPAKDDVFPHDRSSSPEALHVSIDCTGLKPSVEYLMDRTRDVVAVFGVLRDEVSFGFKHWCRGLNLVGYGNHNGRCGREGFVLHRLRRRKAGSA